MNAKQLLWSVIRSRRGLLLGSMLLLIAERVCGLVLPASTKFLVDEVITRHKIHLLIPLLSGVAAATALQAIASFVLNQMLARESQFVVAAFRCRLQAHLSRLSITYFDSSKTGTLVARVMNDVEGLRNLIGAGMIAFAGQLLTSVIALIILARISLLMTGIILACVVVLVAALNYVSKILQPIFKERGKIYAEVTGRLAESIGGIRVVKGYHAEDREEQVFRSGIDRLTKVILRTVTASSIMNMCSTVALGILTMLVMFLGARQIAATRLSLGDFVSYVVFMSVLVLPLGQATAIGGQVSEALAGLDRASEVLNEKREDEAPARTVIPNVEGTVKFEHVTFAYEANKPVLHDVNFEARPGTITALVGPSGAGKSTILGLVAAFYTAQDGCVLIDGIDLKTMQLESYRNVLGVVFQESVLFDGSIRENVSFAAPHATEEQIMQACRIAHVDEFAEQCKEKYDTIVGERGVKLSGGQRQRISIARAILVDPKILILDEATSSLDSESEVFIQQGLMSLMEGRTTFVIAHRLSTVHRADQILVMERGRIIERGTHQSLYVLKGRYFQLYTAQRELGTDHFLDSKEEKVETNQIPATNIEDHRDLQGVMKVVRGAN